MLKYILRRTWQMVPTVFGVIIITFLLFNVVGGSPGLMVLGKHVTPKALEEFDEERGFNKPLLLGMWGSTRAYTEVAFDKSAGPWKRVEGTSYAEEEGRTPGRMVLPAGGRYEIPMSFPLNAGETYRWRVRRIADGASEMRLVRVVGEGEDAEEVDVGTEAFEASATPALEKYFIVVEGADMEMSAIKLQRRARHLFDSQFVFYLTQIAHLDFGESHSTNQRVSKLLMDGILPSLTLTVPIFVVGLGLSIVLALLCAFFRDSLFDRSFVVISVALMSINYLVWIVLGQFILGFKLGWFPVWGYESWAYLMLPVTIGVVSGLGSGLRFYRTVMLDEMYKDYVRTAFAKGVGKSGVLFTHVLKNAMIPIVTNVVIAIPFLYTGSLLLESFFGIPGLGYLSVNAIFSSDVDVIRAVVLIGAVMYVIANLMTDICYALVDPRVKLK